MANVFRSLMVPASVVPAAIAITDALGYPEKGMFAVGFGQGTDGYPLGADDTGAVSTGYLDDSSPILGTAQELWAAVQSRGNPGTVTQSDCELLISSMDITDHSPIERMVYLNVEVADSSTAVPWVQPTGAQDAYNMNDVVSHNGQFWRSLTPANVWEPGVSGWRILWGSATVGYPPWVQPTGAHDAYNLGDKVSHNGSNWESTVAANVWEPGVFGWTQLAP